jgi:hypothetical protein
MILTVSGRPALAGGLRRAAVVIVGRRSAAVKCGVVGYSGEETDPS